MPYNFRVSRRDVLAGLATSSVVFGAGAGNSIAAGASRITKAIPSSREVLPVIGMGSWITFDVGDDPERLAGRTRVLQAFFDNGGSLIDSSPMYGSSEEVIGKCLGRVSPEVGLFSATKVWTRTRLLGLGQMERSEKLWGDRQFDLMQIHNLVDWRTHLVTLLEWKAAGRIRYIGITTSHGRRHDEMARIMESQPIDFVQFTYNLADREVEDRLLPLAAERDLAVIINRPFQRGALLNRLAGKPLPNWAGEIGCAGWPQFALKFVVSHPAVTCAIPATSRMDHMVENMGAGRGILPDAGMRQRMTDYVQSL